ncbi:hypothetical protein DL769_009249 [Monosporascus sp. CRB-8-3]|nr:hypothetical protein DL769_009249 [Monosporascus sp. CRB-8-3]
MTEEEQRPQTSPSEDSEWNSAVSVGSDGPYPLQRREKERREAVIRIAGDDKLDEPAKIDAIGKMRCWFSGDTETLDAYLAGETDTVTAAARLADLIEQTYSTADHGRARYREEMMARGQGHYRSPEIALKMSFSFGGSGTACSVPRGASCGPTRPGKNNLVDLVRALKARPDPALPSPMTILLKRNWIWETGTLWSDLTNVNAFVARLTAGETAAFLLHGMRALREVLEDEIVDHGQHNEAPRLTQLGLLLTVATVWMQIAGKTMYKQRYDDEIPKSTLVSLDRSVGFLASKVDQKARNDELPEEGNWPQNLQR